MVVKLTYNITLVEIDSLSSFHKCNTVMLNIVTIFIVSPRFILVYNWESVLHPFYPSPTPASNHMFSVSMKLFNLFV